MLKFIEEAAERNGGLVKLAEGLGIKHQSFYSWERIPAERVLEFERLSGTPRHKLRPDIYPSPQGRVAPERTAPAGGAAGAAASDEAEPAA